MSTFHLDPDIARQLARDVEEAAQFKVAPTPALPTTPPVSDFTAVLSAALANVQQRCQVLGDDLRHVAEIGFSAAHAAMLADATSAAHFTSVEV